MLSLAVIFPHVTVGGCGGTRDAPPPPPPLANPVLNTILLNMGQLQ